MARPFSSLAPAANRQPTETPVVNITEETRDSLHLFDLPPEVRHRIFSHLLSTKFVHFWSRSQCKPLSGAATYALQWRPWDLDTSVLLANRRLYQEASTIFYKSNLFVRVTILSNLVQLAEILLLEIASHITFIGAQQEKMEACTRHALDVNIMINPSDQKRAQFIIPHTSLNNLTPFLSTLCNETKADQPPLSDLELKVLNSYGLAHNVITETLLEPFRRIFNIARVTIDWPSGPQKYTDSLKKDMSRRVFDAEAWLQSILNLKNSGTRAFENGVLNSSIQFYEQALSSISTAYQDNTDSRRAYMIAMGEGFAKTVGRIRFDCKLGISMAWVNLEDRFDDARRAAMDAHSISCNNHPVDLDRSIPNKEAWFLDSDRAAALFCDGSAAMALGRFREARDQFTEARVLNPYDDAISRAIDQAQRRLDEGYSNRLIR